MLNQDKVVCVGRGCVRLVGFFFSWFFVFCFVIFCFILLCWFESVFLFYCR